MSDSEDSDTGFPFERIQSTNTVCLGVDPNICKLAFDIKHTLYNDIILQGEADTEEAQDILLNDKYESTISILYGLYMNLFRTKQKQNTGIPQEIEQNLPANVKEKIKDLYNQCYIQSTNSSRAQLEHYKLLIHNLFHTYVYDMGTKKR